MKLNKFVLGAVATLAFAVSLQAAEYSLRITGSTAFRTQANAAIRASLTNCLSAYSGSSSSSASKSIFTGTIGSDTFTIYTNFSGSTAGIAQVADQSTTTGWIKRDPTGGDITYTRTSGAGTQLASYTAEAATADLSFSDVDKAVSTRPNAVFEGDPVGVVPFQFVAQNGADQSKVTNMTDQAFSGIWANGFGTLDIITGDPSDIGTYIYASGRDSGSGTRATVLAETKYGVFTGVKQWGFTYTYNNPPTNTIVSDAALSLFADPNQPTDPGNEGYAGSGDMRKALQVSTSVTTYGGGDAGGFIIGYVGASDAQTISGYVEADGTYNTALGPVPMTYNGVRYSKANVISGAYTLWGYQQLYRKTGLSAGQLVADTSLRANIPAQLSGPNVLSITDLNVTRFGGDGGSVLQN